MGCRIEEAQPRGNVESPRLPAGVGRHNADDLARFFEANVIPGPYLVTVGERFGYRDLKFACDLAHVLTLARTVSLSRFDAGCDEMMFPAVPTRAEYFERIDADVLSAFD